MLSTQPSSSVAADENWSRMAHPASLLLQEKSFRNRAVDVGREEAVTLEHGLQLLVERNSSSMLLYYREDHAVLGLVTARDVLRALCVEKRGTQDRLDLPLKDVATTPENLVFAKTTDSLARCQLIMSERRIRNLPVIDSGRVVGLITAKDIMDYSYDPEELGGKASYIRHIANRRGLAPSTQVLVDETERSGVDESHSVDDKFLNLLKGVRATADIVTPRIGLRVGAHMLPHPFKKPGGHTAQRIRDYGPYELATDPALSDDAFFVLDDVPCPHAHGDAVTVVGISDGVGDWRLKGVNPGAYAQSLMRASKDTVENLAANVSSTTAVGGARSERHPVRPFEVLKAAWKETKALEVPGSATALVATLDTELNQISFSNVGDAGMVVLRHIDSNVAGYMREKSTPRHMRQGDLRVAFQSQQQLKSFNAPFQLGFDPEEDPSRPSRFETPRHADVTSFPVLPGDTIVLATDGLFDNVEMEELSAATLAWEKRSFGVSTGELARVGRTADEVPQKLLEELARELCALARRHAVDERRDGPFAMLAKENDIMWSGGMPDDVTVICMRVVKGSGYTSFDVPS